ncbi:hypothetical protein HZA57_05740 [Candidatus Poribacteria bacterium]|nr:hypothetical protein [Candidatus Poribacteria bacterium]
MAFQPELLVLDEPTGGLDPVVRREFLEGLLAEFMESGRTVFISSHLINEIAGLVDHVGIIADGALIRQQPAEQLQREVKRVRLTFDSEPPPAPAFEHLVRERRTGRELLLTLDRFEAERSLGPLQALEPAQLVVEDLSLEDIFVELNHGGEDGT